MQRLPCLIVATAALAGICRADDKREENRRFKGVELYSWKDPGCDWSFALLDGTNRLKTEQEVKAPEKTIKGVEGLKKAFARLALEEHVSWTHLIEGFEFPPAATREEIERAAVEAKVELRIFQR